MGASNMEDRTVLTEFVFNERQLQSTGRSTIKRTVDGKEEDVDIPIQSVGIVELEQEMNAQEPKPPTVTKVVKAKTELADQLGLEKDTPVIHIDMSDTDYRQKLRDHRQRLTWLILARGIDTKFTDEAGQQVTDPDLIIQGLQNSGLTGHQMDQIVGDIAKLTQRREQQANFLSGKDWE